MQKFAIIFFLILITYLNIGGYLHLKVEKEIARYEMKERIIKDIPDSLLTVFELNELQNRLTWKEEGKEFWIGQDLYDIVKMSVINNKTYVFCINDENEEKVIEDYQKNVSKKSPQSNTAKNTTSFFSAVFLNEAVATISNIGLNNLTHFDTISTDILQQDKKILSPPPKDFA
ncbi:MAG TPA: hypothetical protein VF623_08075 [Segetibacter sp.]|jgi:hypothetical protein